MTENFNEQFTEWHNRDKKDDHSEYQFTVAEKDEEPENENDDTEKQEEPVQKISFAELRNGKKIPRLRKSMVLSIMTGGVFLFLFTANMLMRKENSTAGYFDERKNAVETGSDFSLGDLGKRPIPQEAGVFEIAEDESFYMKTPPPYAPVPAYAPAPARTETPRIAYSDSDLLAMKAQIGKEGGYGFISQTAVYDPSESRMAVPSAFPAKEEYTAQRLDDIARLAQMTGSGKQVNTDRMNTGRYSEAGKYNPDNRQAGTQLQYLNDNTLFPGVIIHAILVSSIDTDYPGPIHARVTENVYDSMTGNNLLIPQGTILQGNYSSSSIGIAKVQIAWESMAVNYRGTAYQISLGGMAGVDKRGRAGIAGTLDDHYFEWLKAAGIVSLFTMLNSEVAYQTKGQNNQQIRELMDINQGIVNRIGDRLIERALDIQPTVRVRNGIPVSVSVNAVLELRPFPAPPAEEKWVRK